MSDVAWESESVADEARRLASLAWPAVLGQLGMMLMGVVDVVLCGRLGQDALAAVALGTTWTWGVSVVAIGTCAGLDPLFAQAFGAGHRDKAAVALRRGGLLVLVLSIPTVLLHLAAGPGYALMRQPANLVPIATSYCHVVGMSVPFLLGFTVLRQFLQAAGRMREGAIAVVVGNVVNLVVVWALVYGHLGLPALGTVGAAFGTFFSRIVMFGVLFALGFDLFREAPREPVLDVPALRRIAAVGVPVGIQVGMEVWAFLGTTFLMGWIGETAVAAHIIALNLASISFNVPLGLSAAASARVGNLLGAGRSWTRAGWTAVALGAAVMTFSAVLFMAIPSRLAGLYSEDAPVIALAASLLPLASVFQLFDGTQVVCFGVLRGAGDTRVPALANLVGYWLVGLPVGCTLAFAFGFGAVGLWTGLVLGLATVAVLLLFRLRRTARLGGYRVD